MSAHRLTLNYVCAAVLVSLVACSPADTQTAAVPVAAPLDSIPRTPDGKPDLNGIWQVLSSANNNLEAGPARAAFAMVPGDFVPVPAPAV